MVIYKEDNAQIHVEDEGGWDQVGSNGEGDNWSHSGYILKVKQIELSGRLNVLFWTEWWHQSFCSE